MNSIFKYNPRPANIPNSGGSAKAIPARKSAHDFAEEVFDARMNLAETLKRADIENVLNAKEMKAIFGKHISSVYRYLNAEIPIPAEILIPLVRVLAERGNTEVLALMVPQGFTVVELSDVAPNGMIGDEVLEDVKELGDCVRYFDKHDFRKVRESASKVVTETLSIINEAEILGKGR